MRNIILLTVATVVFCAVGIAYPSVLIAQDTVEEDLESDRPVVRNQHNKDRDMRNRQEGYRDRRGRTTEPPEDPPDQRDPLNDDGEDFNNDGMPDIWEIKYGFSPITKETTFDKDGDGYSNIQEYLLGSDPTDPNSIPLK